MYEWVKAFHIISIIAWMAAMFYLPRLFVYHCDAEAGSVQSETFKVMERRLLKAIMTPAMIASWVFGLWLVFGFIGFGHGWLHVKLAGVVLLSGFHGACAKWTREFAEDRNTLSPGFYRAVNEVPTVLMVLIVIMVVVKPF
ncbi:protoporphyrinogen oxidase HemJ [Tepidamorphus sp. 3E244]|uniref:protoporphyrinogen oxidase HemJ n=1 Tax=Tepidamorphus sp. 3E244 TaxID=3385498 RepID=UPI0038FC6236